jgi:hypothetical protein
VTREEAARRYLAASRAASALPRGSEGQAIHHETMRRIEQRHPQVRAHALVGAGEDFDQPLDRNELEHQRELRRQAGLTNQQTSARRRELRNSHYGAPSPSETFLAANRGSTNTGRASARRSHQRPSPRGGRAARRIARQAPAPISSAGSIIGEFAIAGIALSLLYLLLSKPSVYTTTLGGITGFLRRLTEPTNDLFTASKTPAKAKAAPARTSAPQAGVSSPSTIAAYEAQTAGVFSRTLPSYANLTPTIP